MFLDAVLDSIQRIEDVNGVQFAVFSFGELDGWMKANRPDVDLSKVHYKRDLTPFKDWQAKKFDANWACLGWPKAAGGRGAKPIEQVIWSQEEGDVAMLSGPFIIGIGMAGLAQGIRLALPAGATAWYGAVIAGVAGLALLAGMIALGG